MRRAAVRAAGLWIALMLAGCRGETVTAPPASDPGTIEGVWEGSATYETNFRWGEGTAALTLRIESGVLRVTRSGHEQPITDATCNDSGVGWTMKLLTDWEHGLDGEPFVFYGSRDRNHIRGTLYSVSGTLSGTWSAVWKSPQA